MTLAERIEQASGKGAIKRVSVGHKNGCRVSRGGACDCLPPTVPANRPLPWGMVKPVLDYEPDDTTHPVFAWANGRVIFTGSDGSVTWLPRDPWRGSPRLDGMRMAWTTTGDPT
jgi:hypothetical protein